MTNVELKIIISEHIKATTPWHTSYGTGYGAMADNQDPNSRDFRGDNNRIFLHASRSKFCVYSICLRDTLILHDTMPVHYNYPLEDITNNTDAMVH